MVSFSFIYIKTEFLIIQFIFLYIFLIRRNTIYIIIFHKIFQDLFLLILNIIDKDKILSNNLLFCIHFYDNNNTTITIHDKINENKTNNKNKNITTEQLEKIYNKIKDKTDNLYNIIDKIDLNNFKEKIINELKEFSYDSSIINQNVENNAIFTNNDYLLSMEYFYNFIICTIRDTINSIIEKFLIYSNNPTSYECDIVKINLKYILLKFSQFNDYTDYINKKNTKFIKNLIVNKNNFSS